MVKKALTDLSMSTIRRRLRAMDGWKDVDTDVIHYLACQIREGREDFVGLQLTYEAHLKDGSPDPGKREDLATSLTSFVGWDTYYSNFKRHLPYDGSPLSDIKLTVRILCGLVLLEALPSESIQGMLRDGVLRERKGQVYIPNIFRAYLRREIGMWFVEDYASDPDTTQPKDRFGLNKFVHQYFQDIQVFCAPEDYAARCAQAAVILIQMLHSVRKSEWPTAFFAPDS